MQCTIKSLLRSAASTLILLTLVTCGKDSPTEPSAEPPVQVPARIAITPESIVLAALGQTTQLSATVFDSNNLRMTGINVTWTSSNTVVAAVNAQGVVTAERNGSARITATAGGVSANVSVVVEQVATSLTITPTFAVLTSMGQTVELAAVVYDRNFRNVEEAKISWSSDDPETAAVDAQGVVTAVKNGRTGITATFMETLHATVEVTVSDPGLDRQILVDFYNGRNGPAWTYNTNWLTEAPLDDWYGVYTDDAGRVTTLSLNALNLRGLIPLELGDLSHLEVLSLLENELRGPIPPELGNLHNLFHLDLDENQLSGPIPPQLGNLSNLKYFWVKGNADLSGPLPVEMTRLTNLAIIDLQGTNLCVPPDEAFQTWLNRIGTKRGIRICSAQ